jgi:hypothetical protein
MLNCALSILTESFKLLVGLLGISRLTGSTIQMKTRLRLDVDRLLGQSEGLITNASKYATWTCLIGHPAKAW